MKAFVYQDERGFYEDVNSNSQLAYAAFADYKVVKSMAEKNPSNVILCSTAGEFTPKGYCEGVITGFSYDPEDIEIVPISVPPVKSLTMLKEAYKKVEKNKNAFTLLLCDGLSAMEDAIVTMFYFTAPDYKIIGGSAGDNLAFKETLIYIGNKRADSVALFVNAKTRTQIIKEDLYMPEDIKMLATDADPMRRIVRTFNNKPAATEYARLLDVREEDLPKYFMSNPLGRKFEGETYITSPMKVNSDKSITFYSQIIPNTFVNLMKIADYDQVIASTKKKIEIHPSFTFSVNCILRSLYFIDTGKWNTVNHELLSICQNQTGFISYGEQYYKNHFNQTMVLLLIE